MSPLRRTVAADGALPARATRPTTASAALKGLRFRLATDPTPISVDGYRERARRALPDMIWSYVDHGSETEDTMRGNREAFSRYRVEARMLGGQPPKTLETEVAGRRVSLPVLLAPTGLTGLSHWTGELGAAHGAERAGTLSILSTSSTWSIEEVAAGTQEDHLFQLYPFSGGDGLRSGSAELMERAQRVGYSALFVTVDVPVIGNREWERLRGMGAPPTITPARAFDAARHVRWTYRYLRHQRVSARNLLDQGGSAAAVESVNRLAGLMNPELNWDDIAWMRDRWPGPFYVKGILHPEDARRAMALGADGVVVSNHGGRQLDQARATLDALPAVAAAVGQQGEVLLDGGVRRGSDVVKALCLGATAVCIGRPFIYGLAVDGADGVRAVLEIFREEIQRTLTLMGVESLEHLGPEWLAPASGPGTLADLPATAVDVLPG
ncbi:alpha-hydroxy acid oxidase [Trujillonella endophytica]|uniref:(S)-mandelate dehydrogenase n=1 Tax=Trujillonella endophytica TaxID=673521 RepID=A0A1H8Q5K2_9ACTN|nr:alpha-hydroxy acid oxidase [Trujillella endophytica]SEO49197.1 (S)-mandelate dehydrogenase [Trujillella endophytica]